MEVRIVRETISSATSKVDLSCPPFQRWTSFIFITANIGAGEVSFARNPQYTGWQPELLCSLAERPYPAHHFKVEPFLCAIYLLHDSQLSRSLRRRPSYILQPVTMQTADPTLQVELIA